MNRSSLVLFTGILFSIPALAEDACTRATQHFLFQKNEARERNLSPLDLSAQVEEAAQKAGLSGTPALLSCQAGRPLCLHSTNGNWTLLTNKGPQNLRAEKKNSSIVLTHLTHHYSGGDPWYGIGAQDWTRELRMTLDPATLSLKTLFIDGAETTFGISKRTRAEGRCARTEAEPIRKMIRARLKQELFLSLSGHPSALRENIEANFLIDPSGALLQITELHPQTGEVDLLDLRSEQSHRLAIESLSRYTPVNVMGILRDMNHLRTKTGPMPDGTSLRRLRCVQGANALLNPSNESRDIRYQGYTEIELTRTNTGPGRDLGYTPISKFKITRAGWQGSFRPATLPFGKLEAVAVIDASGNAAFIAPGQNGVQSRPILRMDARTANARHGLSVNLIAFEDMLCFDR
jgi:hypothetical protein